MKGCSAARIDFVPQEWLRTRGRNVVDDEDVFGDVFCREVELGSGIDLEVQGFEKGLVLGEGAGIEMGGVRFGAIGEIVHDEPVSVGGEVVGDRREGG